MKNILKVMAILCFASPAYAAGHALQIELTNGDRQLFLLADKPAVTFSGSDLSIKSASAETSYPRADVQSFSFVDHTTGIADGFADITYSFSDNIFSCNGRQIEVYDMSGLLMAHGTDSVSLRHLPAGIYIIRTNNQTIKVVKQ